MAHMMPREDDQLWAAAARLAGEEVTAIVPAREGANSRVFRVDLRSATAALKCYPVRRGDVRERLETEWATLRFLWSRGLQAVPTPIAYDREMRLMLMEWIEGEAVTCHTRAELEDAIGFVLRISELSAVPEASGFGTASEACFSTAEIIRQINARLADLRPDPLLASFLANELMPAFGAAKSAATARSAAQEQLALEFRRLIPADFGFHNALRQSDGRLRYVDFDYFGWDDPVKLTADFVLHPGMNLSADDKQVFAAKMAGAVPQDEEFSQRLRRQLPLYAIRWALILLNPFRADRDGTALRDESQRVRLMADRIEKARAMCERAVEHVKARD
jgi:hypothetical protein